MKKFKEGTRVIGKGEQDYGFRVKEYPYLDDLEIIVVINSSGSCIRYASELQKVA